VNDNADLGTLARHSSRFLELVNRVRRRHELEIDEAFLFVAVGCLNFDFRPHDVYSKPVSFAAVSEFARVQRETCRRKLLALVDKGLIQRTSYGLLVKDVALWRRLSLMTGPADL
jgi:hypothetical protein